MNPFSCQNWLFLLKGPRKASFFWANCPKNVIFAQETANFSAKNMINRELIRLKIVQLIYAYYQNGDKSIDVAEKELFFSLSKAYDLYHYLLSLMVDITRFAERKIETQQNKAQRLGSNEVFSTKFIDNRFIAQLAMNKQLLEYREKQKKNDDNEDALIRSLYKRIIDSDIYKVYINSEDSSYAADRELWRKLYKTFVCNNEDIDNALEEISLYWNDDKMVVDSFVLKTIKRFNESNGPDQHLLPDFDSDEDREFASRLFRNTIQNAETYRQLIRENSKNWEFNRLALMDIIIMQIALAEIMNFPSIPLNVTFNEYLDIAKVYSTPHSPAYINGLLDHVVKILKKENKILK